MTAAATVDMFLSLVRHAREAMPSVGRPFSFEVPSVRLVVDGRRSVFELRYFPATDVMAALDVRDERFVGLGR